MKALAIGGMRDHVHLLLSLPATITIAKAVQLIKAGSSKWMNDQKEQNGSDGRKNTGVFTIGVSQRGRAATKSKTMKRFPTVRMM